MAKRKQTPDVKPGAGTVNPYAGSEREFKETQAEVAPKRPAGG